MVELDGTTLAHRERHNRRQGCLTHPISAWAQPLLRAAVFTHILAAGEHDSLLFTDSIGAHDLARQQRTPPRKKPLRQPTADSEGSLRTCRACSTG
ncbi:hypothetical protein ACFVZJ_34210 [Streptomyces sp. NPDC058322]|uniref:hypothetical protein n=1 Tax=Streptomyces sp. NPDC058322 TaxID=3346446 RepID=UPI0036E586AE